MDIAQVQCSECGKSFNLDDVIRHGINYVCAACKPVFMQKLSEGVGIGKVAFRYAGFWLRFLAKILDAVIAQVLTIILVFLIPVGGALEAGELSLTLIFGVLILSALFIIYEIVFTAKFGGTLGKMICRIRVVTIEGENISYLLSTGRYFAQLLSAIILYIGFIMAAFDEEKRTLHDRICNTRVVKV